MNNVFHKFLEEQTREVEQKAREEGMQKGMKQTMKATRLLSQGRTIQEIAEETGLPERYIEDLKNILSLK